MSAIAEQYDASSNLAGSPSGASGAEMMDQLKDQCSWLVKLVNDIIEKVSGYDLVEHLIEPLSGDFEGIASMQSGWGEVATSLQAVGKNYDALSQQIPSAWTGPASMTAGQTMAKIGQQHEHQSEGASMIQEQLGHVLEVAQATGQCVVAGLNVLSDIVQEILAQLAIPVLGEISLAATAGPMVARIVSTINRCIAAIKDLLRAAQTAVRVMKTVHQVLLAIKTAVQFSAAAVNVDAGEHTDDTSAAAFG